MPQNLPLSHRWQCQMAAEWVGTIVPFCVPPWQDEARSRHMEPEGPQGAHSAPQATKGPTLTFIIEKEPPVGSRLVYHIRSKSPGLSTASRDPRATVSPVTGQGRQARSPPSKQAVQRVIFTLICAQTESLVLRKWLWSEAEAWNDGQVTLLQEEAQETIFFWGYLCEHLLGTNENLSLTFAEAK